MFGYGIMDCSFMGYALSEHKYTFVLMRGSKTLQSLNYSSRSAATEHMYDILRKLNVQVKKIYDDKHDKTYICSNDYECHINRAY